MKPLTFTGACDASGVVDLGGGFFATGSDEANVVHVHALAGDGRPVQPLTLDDFLDAPEHDEERPLEVDVEGATRIADLTLWITSHGRGTKGQTKPERQRLFARWISGSAGRAKLEPAGRPYPRLLRDLRDAPAYSDWNLRDAARLAPQAPDGLNIEAPCATPAAAEFGPPRALNQGGRGLRDIVRWGAGFPLLAGAPDDERRFGLFWWDEGATQRLAVNLNDTTLDPEALLPHAAGLLVLSEDDSRLTPEQKNADPEKREDRAFRGVHVPPSLLPAR